MQMLRYILVVNARVSRVNSAHVRRLSTNERAETLLAFALYNFQAQSYDDGTLLLVAYVPYRFGRGHWDLQAFGEIWWRNGSMTFFRPMLTRFADIVCTCWFVPTQDD